MKLKLLSVVAATLLLAGCSGDNADDQSTANDESISNAATATAEFQAQQVDPVLAPFANEPVHDPGLNIDVLFQGTAYGNSGGSIIYVAVTNRNDMALPVSALGQPTLKIVDSNGNTTNISSLNNDDNVPLDLPLGSLATTNLQYAFDVNNGSLSSAEFQIGNVVFDGNLNNR